MEYKEEDLKKKKKEGMKFSLDSNYKQRSGLVWCGNIHDLLGKETHVSFSALIFLMAEIIYLCYD